MAQAMDDYCAYYIRTKNLNQALKRLEYGLNRPDIEIPGSEHDRVALVRFQNFACKLPIFATLCGKAVDGYSVEVDTVVDLAIGDRDVLVKSGVFAPVVSEPIGGRFGIFDGVEVALMQTRIWFDLDPQYALITLDYLSQQRYGVTEEYPLYQELHEALKDFCDYCLINYDPGGMLWDRPQIPERYLPREYCESAVDPAVDELIAHHSRLPPHLLDKWPIPR